MLTQADRALLTSTFEKLGPEKVQLGLTGIPGDATKCFLARAYGKDGELITLFSTLEHLGTPLGLTKEECGATIAVFDGAPDAFRCLAHEWLELNRTKVEEEIPVCAGKE